MVPDCPRKSLSVGVTAETIVAGESDDGVAVGHSHGKTRQRQDQQNGSQNGKFVQVGSSVNRERVKIKDMVSFHVRMHQHAKVSHRRRAEARQNTLLARLRRPQRETNMPSLEIALSLFCNRGKRDHNSLVPRNIKQKRQLFVIVVSNNAKWCPDEFLRHR